MADTYTITLERKCTFNPFGIFNKKLKKVKGFDFPREMNPGNDLTPGKDEEGKDTLFGDKKGPTKHMYIVFADESCFMVNLDQWAGYHVSKELFYIKARQVKEETNGGTDLTQK